MKNKNGFTLIEILTVVTIVAVLIIILIPILGRAFRQAKNALSDMDKKSLIDGTKLYVNNLVDNGYNVVTKNNYDSSCNFINSIQTNKLATYLNNGTELSGYKFVEYAAQNDLYVTAEYLVENGYYDSSCIYDQAAHPCENSSKCKIDKECTLVVHFNSDRVNANPSCTSGNCEYYYTLGDYTVTIQDESKCKIK